MSVIIKADDLDLVSSQPIVFSRASRNITLSMGVAVSTDHRNGDVASLLNQADRGLYTAKQGGRESCGALEETRLNVKPIGVTYTPGVALSEGLDLGIVDGIGIEAARLLSLQFFYLRRFLVKRREYPRYFVNLKIEIKEVGNSFQLRSATTDVSLGGCCYIGTIYPLAAGSQIDFTMRVARKKRSRAQLMQRAIRGVGMGIQFIDLLE